MSARGGFTLVELAVALLLGLMVGGLVHRLLLHGQRLARAQAERLAMQDNVRSAALVLTAELSGVGYDEVSAAAAASLGHPAGIRSDLLAVEPGAVTYLVGRGDGIVCRAASGTPAEIAMEEASWSSPRAPRVTDSLLVFAESDPATAVDDAWIHLGIVSVGIGSCPGGGPGRVFRVAIAAPLDLTAALARVTPGGPVRLVEVMQARLYQSGGRSWLGMRSVSTGEPITPVVGPLADSTGGARGLTLTYRDAADAPTSIATAVRTVEIALLGVTDQAIYGRDLRRPAVDSFALTSRVALRNAPRP